MANLNMRNLVKKLSSLPQAKLSRRADFKIKFSLYRLMFLSSIEKMSVSWKMIPLLTRGLSFAAIILLIFGTSSVYAYTSDTVIPGNPLYPLKLAVEKVEKVTAITPAAQVAVNEKLSDRRLKEAVNLSRTKVDASPENSEKISQKIENSITAAINNHQVAVEAKNKEQEAKNNFSENRNNQVTSIYVQENDQAQTNYLNQIKKFAETSQDQRILDKVDEAHQEMNKSNNDYELKKGNDSSNNEKQNNNNEYNNFQDKPNRKSERGQNRISSSTPDLSIPLNQNLDLPTSLNINLDIKDKEGGAYKENND